MNHADRMRVVAERVRDFVTASAEGKRQSYSEFLRGVRLELGVGDLAVRRVLRQDYGFQIEDDRLVRA